MSTPPHEDGPAALVESDETPVVLRVKIGYYFDVMGTLDLHESGKVTASANDPTWLFTLRGGYLMCWRGDESRPPADILRELPTRWHNYLWAGVAFDHTGDTTQTEEGQRSSMAHEGKTDESRAEEIDLSADEEAALDRAWERIRQREALRRQQQSGKTTSDDNDEAKSEQDEEEDA